MFLGIIEECPYSLLESLQLPHNFIFGFTHPIESVISLLETFPKIIIKEVTITSLMITTITITDNGLLADNTL